MRYAKSSKELDKSIQEKHQRITSEIMQKVSRIQAKIYATKAAINDGRNYATKVARHYARKYASKEARN